MRKGNRARTRLTIYISLMCLQTCPCITALRSCRTACLASGGCSGDSMSSTDFHTASTACWGTCVCTDFSKHKGLSVPLHQTYHLIGSHLFKPFGFGKLTNLVQHTHPAAQTTVWVELLQQTKTKNIMWHIGGYTVFSSFYLLYTPWWCQM